MADLGHQVVGVDVDEAKVKELSAGRAPFFEPGLPELLARAMASGRLRFDHDMSVLARPQATPGATTSGTTSGTTGGTTAGTSGAADPWVHFVCVGTPQRSGEFAADTT